MLQGIDSYKNNTTEIMLFIIDTILKPTNALQTNSRFKISINQLLSHISNQNTMHIFHVILNKSWTGTVNKSPYKLEGWNLLLRKSFEQQGCQMKATLYGHDNTTGVRRGQIAKVMFWVKSFQGMARIWHKNWRVWGQTNKIVGNKN